MAPRKKVPDLGVISTFGPLIRRIFEAQGYTVIAGLLGPNHPTDPSAPDFVFRDRDGKTLALEARVYSSDISESVLANLIRNLVDRWHGKYDRLGVVVTAAVTPEQESEVKHSGVEMFDANTLLNLLRDHASLRRELSEFLLQVRATPFRSWLLLDQLDQRIRNSLKSTPTTPQAGRGQEISELFNKTLGGREHAKKFEQVCEAAIKYLFENNFTNWSPQQRLAEDLHIGDLVAKLTPETELWGWVAKEFHTRYVIFEFKNYREAISQGEIYTTEKYLFLRGMRAVAVIVALNGASESAKSAARGALREAGKLILCFSWDDVVEMLLIKDDGREPNDFVAKRLDEFMLNLGR